MKQFSLEVRREARRMWVLAAATLERGISLDGLTDDELDVMIGAVLSAAERCAIEPLIEALEHILNGALSLPRFAEDAARAALAKARGEA